MTQLPNHIHGGLQLPVERHVISRIQQPIQFPRSRCALWSSIAAGNTSILHMTYYRKPSVSVGLQALRVAYKLMSKQLRTSKGSLHGMLLGDVKASIDQEGVMLTLDRIDIPPQCVINSMTPYSPNDYASNYAVPCLFCIGTEECAFPDTTHNLVKSLDRKLSSQKLCFSNALAAGATCTFDVKRQGLSCSLKLNVLIPSTTLQAAPIQSLPILPTALARNLISPYGRGFADHKSGYLTMNETRHLVLMLENDPKATVLPLVGIWVSGTIAVHSIFVWAACLRFMFCEAITDRVCIPPDPFLLVLYPASATCPSFYEINQVEDLSLPKYRLLSSVQHFYVNQDTQKGVLFDLEESESNLAVLKDAVTQQDMTKSVTPKSKLSFSNEETLETLNLSEVRASPMPSSSTLVHSTDSQESRKTSTTNSSTSSSEHPSTTGDEGSIPSALHRVLATQELELQKLRQMVEELLRDRHNNSQQSNGARCLPASPGDLQILVAPPQSAITNRNFVSASTMTSFNRSFSDSTDKLQSQNCECKCQKQASSNNNNPISSTGCVLPVISTIQTHKSNGCSSVPNGDINQKSKQLREGGSRTSTKTSGHQRLDIQTVLSPLLDKGKHTSSGTSPQLQPSIDVTCASTYLTLNDFHLPSSFDFNDSPENSVRIDLQEYPVSILSNPGHEENAVIRANHSGSQLQLSGTPSEAVSNERDTMFYDKLLNRVKTLIARTNNLPGEYVHSPASLNNPSPDLVAINKLVPDSNLAKGSSDHCSSLLTMNLTVLLHNMNLLIPDNSTFFFLFFYIVQSNDCTTSLLPTLNYRTLHSMFEDNEGSFEFDALVVKYLKDSELIREDKAMHSSTCQWRNFKISSISMCGLPPNEVTMATKQYMERYGLNAGR